MAGILIGMTGGLWLVLQSGAPTQPQFMTAVTLFLAGMGLINPIGTAIALEPFGDRAGIASALLGFLQMACAAIGTAIIGALSVGPATAFAWVVLGGTALAAATFFPVFRIGNVKAMTVMPTAARGRLVGLGSVSFQEILATSPMTGMGAKLTYSLPPRNAHSQRRRWERPRLP